MDKTHWTYSCTYSILEEPHEILGRNLYWVTQKLPQIYTANHATFPIEIRKITVQICGILWVTQYLDLHLSLSLCLSFSSSPLGFIAYCNEFALHSQLEPMVLI